MKPKYVVHIEHSNPLNCFSFRLHNRWDSIGEIFGWLSRVKRYPEINDSFIGLDELEITIENDGQMVAYKGINDPFSNLIIK